MTAPRRQYLISVPTLVLATATMLFGVLVSASASAQGSPALPADLQTRCDLMNEALGHLPDPSTHLREVNWRPQGTQIRTMMGPQALPGHCEIVGSLQERTGVDGQRYAVRFHLRLPEHWNGRLLFEGGGGTEGDLGAAVGAIGAGPPALMQGYATVSQDAGHDNATNTDPQHGGPVAFGFDPQARANYGGAALGVIADTAKAALRNFYGQPPSHSYFYGCSKGGQEGMQFAQRFPAQFDGIVAGAPGFALPRAAIAEAWDTQAFSSMLPAAKRATPGAINSSMTDPQFETLRQAILAACDADDGVKDGITANVGACKWQKVARQLRKHLCASQPEAGCLMPGQIEALQRIFGGPRTKSGGSLYADWPIDAGAGSPGWRQWKIGSADGRGPSINVAMGAPALAAVFTTPPTALPADIGASLRYALNFDFDRDAPRINAIAPPYTTSAWADISAHSTDLSKFKALGGKMIVFQGASDPVFSLNDTLAWYRQLNSEQHGSAGAFVRVFPVPGMGHCAGGPATDQFDALAALVDWVEHGAAPASLLARAGPGTPWPGRSRPLCAYPQMPHYTGSGNIEDAASFRCQ